MENVEAVRRQYCSTLHHVTGQTVWAADWNEPGCKNNMSILYSQAVYWTLPTSQSGYRYAWLMIQYIALMSLTKLCVQCFE